MKGLKGQIQPSEMHRTGRVKQMIPYLRLRFQRLQNIQKYFEKLP